MGIGFDHWFGPVPSTANIRSLSQSHRPSRLRAHEHRRRYHHRQQRPRSLTALTPPAEDLFAPPATGDARREAQHLQVLTASNPYFLTPPARLNYPPDGVSPAGPKYLPPPAPAPGCGMGGRSASTSTLAAIIAGTSAAQRSCRAIGTTGSFSTTPAGPSGPATPLQQGSGTCVGHRPPAISQSATCAPVSSFTTPRAPAWQPTSAAARRRRFLDMRCARCRRHQPRSRAGTGERAFRSVGRPRHRRYIRAAVFELPVIR